jgi:hypothetical protein
MIIIIIKSKPINLNWSAVFVSIPELWHRVNSGLPLNGWFLIELLSEVNLNLLNSYRSNVGVSFK